MVLIIHVCIHFFNRQINHPKIENRFYSCTYIILTEHEIDFQNLNVVLKTVTIHVFNPQIKPTEHKKIKRSTVNLSCHRNSTHRSTSHNIIIP